MASFRWGLDISDMLADCDQLPPMERLMEYIEAHQGKILIVPDDIEDTLILQLHHRGFAVSSEADAALAQVVDELCDSEQFEGYQALLSLVEEFIWQKVIQGEMRDDDILKQDVNFICKTNGYISRLKSGTHKARKRMGFGVIMEG